MNVSISFPTEIENVLRRRAAVLGKDVETFVREVVTERLAEEEPSVPHRRMSHEEFTDRLQRFIDRRGISTNPVDDSRESIYAGRGE